MKGPVEPVHRSVPETIQEVIELTGFLCFLFRSTPNPASPKLFHHVLINLAIIQGHSWVNLFWRFPFCRWHRQGKRSQPREKLRWSWRKGIKGGISLKCILLKNTLRVAHNCCSNASCNNPFCLKVWLLSLISNPLWHQDWRLCCFCPA